MMDIPKVSFRDSEKARYGFEILTFRHLFEKRRNLHFLLTRPHKVTFYHIFFMTRGTGTHFIDFTSHAYKEGSVIFVSRGQVHAFDFKPENDGIIMIFTEAFLNKNLIHSDVLSFYRLYNYHLHSPVMQPEEIEKESFEPLVSQMCKEYAREDDFAKEHMLRLLLKQFLLKAERVKRTRIEGQKNAEWVMLFYSFRDKLEDHYAETRNANDYAGLLHISYKHLNTVCKHVAGKTAKEIIDEQIVLDARRHLATSDVSIKSLAYKYGFVEITNFVKYFKKHTGHTPSKFRQTLTN